MSALGLASARCWQSVLLLMMVMAMMRWLCAVRLYRYAPRGKRGVGCGCATLRLPCRLRRQMAIEQAVRVALARPWVVVIVC